MPARVEVVQHPHSAAMCWPRQPYLRFAGRACSRMSDLRQRSAIRRYLGGVGVGKGKYATQRSLIRDQDSGRVRNAAVDDTPYLSELLCGEEMSWPLCGERLGSAMKSVPPAASRVADKHFPAPASRRIQCSNAVGSADRRICASRRHRYYLQ